MLSYQLIYIVLLLTFLLSIKLKNKIFLYYLMIILLFIFSASRDFIGHDFDAYANQIFNKVPNLNELMKEGLVTYKYIHGEYLFLFLNTVLKSFGLDYRSIFVLMSFLSLYFLTKYFKEEFTKNLNFPLYLYYSMYFLSDIMSIIRYGLVSLMLLYSLKYIFEKKKKKFIIIIIIASFIQSASIIYIFTYFINKIRIKNRTLFFVVIFSIIFSKLKLMKFFLIQTIEFYPEFIRNQINSYIFNQTEFKFSLYQIYIFLIFIIFIYFSKSIKEEKKYELYLKLYAIGICIYFIFSEIPTFAGRLSGLFLKSDIFLFTMLYFNIKKIYIKVIYIIFIVIIMTYFYESYIQLSLKVFLPYKSWLLN